MSEIACGDGRPLALLGDRSRRPRLALIVALIATAAAVLSLTLTFSSAAGRSRKWDFSLYYASSFALRLGQNPYASDITPIGERLGLETGAINRAADTPFFLLALEPLTYVRPEKAVRIWLLLCGLATASAFYLLLKPMAEYDAATALIIAACAVLYPPLTENILASQSQGIVLFLLTATLLSVCKKRSRLAGVFIAVAGLLRAYPLFFLGFLIVRRDTRALFWAIGVSAIGVLLTVMLVGWAPCLSFVESVGRQNSGYLSGHPSNVAVAAFIPRLIGYVAGGSASRTDWSVVSKSAVIATDAIVIAATTYAAFHTPRTADGDMRAFTVWLTAMILVCPVAWMHYLVLLYIPMFLIVGSALTHRASFRAVAAISIAFALPILHSEILRSAILSSFVKSLRLDHFVLEFPFVSLAVAYVATLWYARDRIATPANLAA